MWGAHTWRTGWKRWAEKEEEDAELRRAAVAWAAASCAILAQHLSPQILQLPVALQGLSSELPGLPPEQEPLAPSLGLTFRLWG